MRKWQGSWKKKGKTKRQQVSVELLLLSTTVIVISIVANEYLLKANKITKINESLPVGQLLALLVPAIGFVAMMPGIPSERLYRRLRCWILFGRHLSCRLRRN